MLVYSIKDLIETIIRKVPNILLNNFLSILYFHFLQPYIIVTGTKTKKPSKLIYPILSGVLTLLISFPPMAIVRSTNCNQKANCCCCTNRFSNVVTKSSHKRHHKRTPTYSKWYRYKAYNDS